MNTTMRRPGLRFPFTIAATVVLAGGRLAAQAASYDELVAEAEALRGERKLDAAYAAASKACQLAPKRFEGFLLGALVLFEKGAEAEATSYLAHARDLAPADKRAGMEQLQALLGAGSAARQAAQHRAAGQEARAAGLHAKAAEELLAAHRLLPHDIEIAREAVAELTMREQWFELAQVLRAVSQSPDPQQRTEAMKLAETAKPLLQREHDASLATAEAAFGRLDWAAAAAELERTVVFDPDSARAHHLLGQCRCRLGDVDGALVALRAALACGHYVAEEYYGVFELNRLLGEPAYMQLLADAFGEQARTTALAGYLPPADECARLRELAAEAASAADWSRAAARLRDGLALCPADPDLTFERARNAALAGQVADVPTLLDDCLAHGFADPGRWFGCRQLYPFVFDAARIERAQAAWGTNRYLPFSTISDEKYAAGDTDGALGVLLYAERWFAADHNLPMRRARLFARAGRNGDALQQLAAAADLGYPDLDFVLRSREFDALRNHDTYKRALLKIAQNKEKR